MKPSYFLDLDGLKLRMTRLKNAINNNGFCTMPKISPFEFFSLSLRNLFFNMLNDSFILLIFWLTLYGSAILLSLTNRPGEDEFRLFSETMALVGIISGLFQFYVKDYKEKNTKIINSLIEKRLSEIKTISFLDFKNYLSDHHLDSFVAKIDRIIKGRNIQTPSSILPYYVRKDRREFPVFNIYNQINRPIGLNDAQLFTYFENYADCCSELKKTDLLKYYESYLSEKRNHIRKMSEIKELRKLIFTAIFFSDEVFYSYLKTLSSLPKQKDKPENIVELTNNFGYDCVFDLVEDIISYEPKYSINDCYHKYGIYLSIIFGLICLFVIILVPLEIFG